MITIVCTFKICIEFKKWTWKLKEEFSIQSLFDLYRNRESRCPQVLTFTWVSETLHCLFGWRAHICLLTCGGIYKGLSVIEFMSNCQIIMLTCQNKMIRPTCSSLISTLMPQTSIYLSIKYLRNRHNYLIRRH